MRPTFAVLMCIAVTLTACSKGKKSSASSATSSSAVTISASPTSVAPGQTSTLTVSGGSGVYVNATVSQGTLQQTLSNIFIYKAPSSITSNAASVTITDSSGNVGYITIGITGTILSISANPSSIALSAQSTLTVVGGTAPFAWQIVSGGGTLSATTGASVTFSAPNAAGATVISVNDSSGGSAQTTVLVGATSGGGTTGCGGTYSATIGGITATISLTQDGGTSIAGYLLMYGYYYPVTGTCAISGSTGTVTFTDLINNNSYTGAVTVTGTQVSITGTLTAAGIQYNWTATNPTAVNMSAPAQSCEGMYNAVIAANAGTMALVENGTGAFEGYLLLQGYYYALSGTCTGTTITMTNLTTNSHYTGTVNYAAPITMTGNFTLMDGTPYTWSATHQ